jgi:hypothetical protein
MATGGNSTIGKSRKVFVDAGKLKVKLEKGKYEDRQVTLVMSQEHAELIGAKFTASPPAAKTIVHKKGKMAGRSFKRAVSDSLTKVKYRIGYLVGRDKTTGKPKVQWVGLHIPEGLNTQQVVEIIRRRFSKKPVLFETPAGVRTRFVSTK